jgi:carbon-monoxide dehydrogenase small subunit
MSTEDTTSTPAYPTEEVSLTINGTEVTDEVQPRLKLSDYLRREHDLRGLRVGCEHGVCGACTVLMDGDPIKACLVYAVQAYGAAVETVEGLADGDGLHPIQEAFHQEHALQCGFCTSGFVMATKALLDENPDPDREDVEHGLADNICRCTGYENIYDAVYRAADDLQEGERDDLQADEGDDVDDGRDSREGEE